MKRVTVVVECGDLGAEMAVQVAVNEGLWTPRWRERRDGTRQITALAEDRDPGARARWVKACRRLGLAVARAPWEKPRDAVKEAE